MDGILINRVGSVKFLGMYIDEHLNFKEHVDFLISKLNSIKGMIYSRRAYLPDSCRIKLYFSLVFSRLQYGIEVYCLTNKNIIESLHVACNRVLRSLQCVSRYSSVKSLYTKYNTLPISLLGNLYISKFIYRSLNDQNGQLSLRNAACQLFQLNCACHNYPTRISSTNYLYKKSSKAFLSSYVSKCCSIWNEIPVNIRSSPSAKAFIYNYKKLLFEKL